MRWMIASLTCAALVQGVWARSPEEKVQVRSDVVFGKVGEQELTLDLAIPVGPGPFPAVVCLRGGFWQYGSTKAMTGTITELAKRGYLAAAVGYRQPPAHPFPAAIEDCKCAIRWLRANGQELHLHPDAVGVLGLDSGGCHLALLLGLTSEQDGLDGASDLSPENRQQSSRVRTIVGFFGPTDLTANHWSKPAQERLATFIGGPLSQKEQAYRQASPRTYVRQRPQWPMIMLFHGTKDEVVPYAQSVTFVDAVKKAGGPAFLISLDGEGHGWRGTQLTRTLEMTFDFFDQNLKSPVQASR